MILSILIPTIENRKEKFDKLIEELFRQNDEVYSRVQIIGLCDNKEISIGSKRQRLLTMAQGDYVVFIDDDDMVSDDYIEEILEALKKKPDFVGFNIECTFNGLSSVMADVSNIYNDWANDLNGFKFVRTPYHKTPIKRQIALKIGFRDMRYAEDYDFSSRLKKSGLIKKEQHINKVLYYYKFVYEDPKVKYGI